MRYPLLLGSNLGSHGLSADSLVTLMLTPSLFFSTLMVSRVAFSCVAYYRV